MAVYSVEGKLGTGKTKFAVWRACEALRAGRRVASNVDLNLKLACKLGQRAAYIRVPDKPTEADLLAIGHGNPGSYDEDRNGVLILDELATWLNSRSFQDKARAGVLDWLIHARKHGWDVYLIVQDSGMIDKQVREALVEYKATCIRLDKVKLPLIGGILNDLFGGRAGYLPRMHCVTARVGDGHKLKAESWYYRGDWIHSVYDTRQVFKAGDPEDPPRSYSVLHPEHFDQADHVRWWHRLGVLQYRRPAPPAPRTLKPKTARAQLLARLPPAQRLEVAARWSRSGLL